MNCRECRTKKKKNEKEIFFGECLVGRGRGKRNVRPIKKFFSQNEKEIRDGGGRGKKTCVLGLTKMLMCTVHMGIVLATCTCTIIFVRGVHGSS